VTTKTAASFVLWSVIDGRVTIDEELWDREQLRLRLAEVVPVPGYQVFWSVADTELRVDVVRQDGMVLSSWQCPECGAPETCWDLKPTPEMVIGKLSSHSCEGYVTGSADDATWQASEPAADSTADDVNEHQDVADDEYEDDEYESGEYDDEDDEVFRIEDLVAVVAGAPSTTEEFRELAELLGLAEQRQGWAA
jgi:hypothetical protein